MPVCRLCPGRSNFMNEGALRNHQESKHGYCQICNKAFVFKAALRQHIVDKHPRCYYCNTCSAPFRSQQAVDQHTETKHRHRYYYCGVCGTVLRSQQALNQHTEAKHRHCCDTCSTVLHSKEAVDQHRTDKHAALEWMVRARVPSLTPDTREAQHPPRFECQNCDLKFSTDDARRNHENNEHHGDLVFASDDARLRHKNTKNKLPSQWSAHSAQHNPNPCPVIWPPSSFLPNPFAQNLATYQIRKGHS
ncbi:hypothetical protein BDN67DRAFT_708079 [Paxillus ammoniavirescens]|nr:hypothetical protein BDN67DRAFT_708079 [Paxillus ammoniavirescens]